MRFIRKNGHIIPIRNGNAPSKSKPKKSGAVTIKHINAKNFGYKVGALTSVAFTPLIGIPAGYIAYKHRDK